MPFYVLLWLTIFACVFFSLPTDPVEALRLSNDPPQRQDVMFMKKVRFTIQVLKLS